MNKLDTENNRTEEAAPNLKDPRQSRVSSRNDSGRQVTSDNYQISCWKLPRCHDVGSVAWRVITTELIIYSFRRAGKKKSFLISTAVKVSRVDVFAGSCRLVPSRRGSMHNIWPTHPRCAAINQAADNMGGVE